MQGGADRGFARLLATGWAKAKPTFARLLADAFANRRRDFARLLARSAGQGRREGNGEAKAKLNKKDGDGAYLLKPSPIIVAGLTPCVADAKATAVAKIRIKQFWAIRLGRQGGRPLSRDGSASKRSLCLLYHEVKHLTEVCKAILANPVLSIFGDISFGQAACLIALAEL